jgi:hypothetical protein
MLQEGILPKEAITAAMAVLKNPPAEDIWVTHGLLMAGLAAVADVSPIKGLIPDVGAVQELTII